MRWRLVSEDDNGDGMGLNPRPLFELYHEICSHGRRSFTKVHSEGVRENTGITAEFDAASLPHAQQE